MDAPQSATPARAPAGAAPMSPALLSDADGSPLPTPPRVSHIYGAPDAPPPADAPPHSPRASPPRRSPDSTVRPDTAPALDMCQTPAVPLSRTLRGGPRSVGRSLRKLRTAPTTSHVPARRVERYEDDDSDEAPPQSPRPPLVEVPPNIPAPTHSGADKPQSAPRDYMQLMLDEARREPAEPVPSARAPKETSFRGCRFFKERRVGEGGFSTVWQVRGPAAIPSDAGMTEIDEARQGRFAMKQVSLRRLEAQSRDELVQEAELLEQLAHKPGNERYILRYFGYRVNRDTLKIMLELGEKDFSHVLKTQTLSHDDICTYWRQMLEAVHFVHEQAGLVHTDLKPANFLLTKGTLKLIDFGIAQKIPLGTIHISRDVIIGTPNYMAPEAIRIAKAHGRRVYKAGKASDVWSLGCILYQMVYGRPPFDRLPAERKLEVITDPEHTIAFPATRVADDPASERVAPELLAAMQAALRYDAQRRATIPELLHSPLLCRDAPDETVTLTRQMLRDLVARLRLRTLQGELTDENVLERADVLFANLQQAAATKVNHHRPCS